MRILPGKPRPHIQSLCAGEWDGTRLIAYASGTALVILRSVDDLLQTIYHDEEVNCVAINDDNGEIVVSTASHLVFYKPFLENKSKKKWAQHDKIELSKSDGSPHFLSWGPDSELLVGGSCLSLYSFASESNSFLRTWHRALANPAKFAMLSYDGSLIASAGFHDRLVKVWRRQTFASGEPQFDFSYLPHAATVTAIYWRKPLHKEMSFENVLYTLSSDQILRVWSPSDSHDGHLLHMWASIELGFSENLPEISLEKNQPISDLTAAHPPDDSMGCFGTILDSNVFKLATESVIQHGPKGENGADMLQRLVEIANRSPELCVIMDRKGRLSVWGLENVGCKGSRTTNAFRIVQNIDTGLSLPLNGSFVQLLAFCENSAERGLIFIVHVFNGEIYWLETRLDELLDPSPSKARIKMTGIWYGHSEAIKALNRTANGGSLLSSSGDSEHVLWLAGNYDGTNTLLERKSIIEMSSTENVQHSVIFENGDYLVTLHQNYVTLWDCRSEEARRIEKCHFQVQDKWLCLLVLPEVANKSHIYHIAAISSKAEGIAWEVQITSISPSSPRGFFMREVSRFDLQMKHDLQMMVPVDPVGWEFILTGTLDRFSRDVAVSLTSEGQLRTWTAKVSAISSEVSWLETAKVDTMIPNASLARGSSIRKVAVVDEGRTELTIWDNRGQQLEFKSRYPNGEIVQDLDWTSTPDSQSILAVGFPHRVLLLSQLRYDYLSAGPAWAPFREINIESTTSHPIGDSTWLGNGTLVIGAGNQLFLNSKYLPTSQDDNSFYKNLQVSALHKAGLADIFDVVARLNGPIPIYHPQFLQQCILAGKTLLVEKVLLSLHDALENKDIDGPLKLQNFLDVDMNEFLEGDDDLIQHRSNIRRTISMGMMDSINEDAKSFDEELSASLSTLLKDVPIPYLTGQEQIALAGINECVSEVAKHRRSIDENGSRFLLFFKQHSLRRDQLQSELTVSFREVVWAYHSNSQEILVDLVSKTYQGKMMWHQARDAGIFMWLQDIEAVRNQFENLARNHYTQNENRNPIDCSLHYLALKKKTVLLGLWRMAHWNKEQPSTYKFLSNNFDEPRWKTAALKNAYALLGKQRFEYAAAFFLLADSIKDAINVCFNQLNDMQLAITVARVYEGDDGPNLKSLLEDKVLPLAAKEGNKWLATWAFWMLRRRDLAVRAIISPIHSLISAPESPEMDSKLFLTEDPALIILYKQIRDKTLQTLRGAEKISPSTEFQFVLHTTRLYDRMGCDVLGLDLVKNWTFLQSEAIKPLIEHDPRKNMRRRRSSITVSDVADDEKLSPTASRSGLVKPPPSVFEEPTMDSFSHFDF